MLPLPTVWATPVPKSAPHRFMTAATSSAARGFSARVDTDVATAFAASWNPFVYAKMSAVPMTPIRATSRTLRTP